MGEERLISNVVGAGAVGGDAAARAAGGAAGAVGAAAAGTTGGSASRPEEKRPLLHVQDVAVSFEGRPVLRGVSLELHRGELVSLLGASGGGKTTLFNVISGLLAPDEGRVLLDGRPIDGLTGHVSYMMQKDLLLESMRVADNVGLPLRLRGAAKAAARAEAEALLPSFGLAGAGDLWPSQLSGGMRQRAALARTYLFSRDVMLLDEPFSALDAITKSELHAWFLEMQRRLGLSVLFVTHDIDEAVLLSDRVLVLAEGRIAADVAVEGPAARTPDFALTPEFLECKRQVREFL
ncbi:MULTISPECIES: ABC transporter ATP-binding protein [unclassified Adlercreutzia]|uniref:ABC transporter ATP-binding protein n=1 Tax=unclassified Adlercreutzia TaxID=2636013 RepID=UPI00198213F1|nr:MULTISPECIES: ABC transporter ATP-binding protein [unclassified Adlercreutzia]